MEGPEADYPFLAILNWMKLAKLHATCVLHGPRREMNADGSAVVVKSMAKRA